MAMSVSKAEKKTKSRIIEILNSLSLQIINFIPGSLINSYVRKCFFTTKTSPRIRQPERPNGHDHISCKAWRGAGNGERQ